jgi:hypothetical protein
MMGKRARRSLAMALSATVASGSGLVVLSLLLLPAACTSGTTPNCADAAEMCDPYEAGPDSGIPSEAGPGETGVAESSTSGG